MNKKRWALLILVILLIVGYYKLFYKRWSNEAVVKNADCIIALDVKRITNTLIWNFITTPSQWKNSDLFSSSDDDKVSWDDMIALPDYVFVFHKTGQPDNAFYTVVQVNDEEDFEKGLKQFHFEKTTAGSYVSKEAGIELIQSGNKLLLGNAAVEDKKYMQQVADELFNKKEFIAEDLLKGYTSTNNHLSAMVPFNQNSFSGNGSIFFIGNFDKNSITFSASLQPKFGINLTTNQFKYSDSSLCSVGCTQPWPDVRKLLPDSSWSNISKAVNFNIDSLLLQSNHCYQLDVAGIYPRIDSAISYTYDNDFNPIEKVVVNKVEEPAFNFMVHGDSVSNIYSYWNNSGKIEKVGDSNLFTPVPFVKSCCKIKNDNTLAVTSGNYTTTAANKLIDCIFFAKLLLTKMPSSLLHYFPADILKVLKNIESAAATITNEKGQIILLLRFNKKKNDLPLIEL